MRDPAFALVDQLESIFARGALTNAIRYAATRQERLNAIRTYYVKTWPAVRDTETWKWAVDPYEVDWRTYFTPIESALWYDIRAEGMVLYPQHPVAGYFVDFGHPKARVAIECDGAAYHTDKERDRARERAISANGWTIYRFTGSECVTDFKEVDDMDTGCPRLIPSETRLRLREIAKRHQLSPKHLEVA
jgi:very-short-patch-repair endonuclease